MPEPAVLDPVTLDPLAQAALAEGWIRAVLFEHAIDDWVELGPDPIRRRHVGQIYADHVGAAYGAWKWLSDNAGTDIDVPPAEQATPEALALEVRVTSWTELMVALLTVGRAQSLLFAELAARGETVPSMAGARRTFDRVGRDFAGHAALAFLELHRGAFIDPEAATAALARFVPATQTLLAGTELAARWEAGYAPLAEALGLKV